MRTNKLAEKFNEARAAGAVAVNPPLEGKTMIETLDSKITVLEAQQTALVRERADLLLAALDGNSDASKKADTIGRQLEAIERDLASLATARARAIERRADAEAAAAAQAEADHREEVRKATIALGLAADLVDGHLEQLRMSLVELADRRDELRRLLAGSDEAFDVLKRFSAWTPAAIQQTLATARWGFGSHFDDRTRTARVCDELPSFEAVVAGLERDKRKATARRQRLQAAE